MPYKPPIHDPMPGRRRAPREQRQQPAYYNSGEWAALRAAVLDRDGYRCQIKLPGCHVTANTVDHIHARRERGADVMRNLRACCRPCHNKRHAEKGGHHL